MRVIATLFVFIYLSSAQLWSQYGNKLTGSGTLPSPTGVTLGFSVAVSGDGVRIAAGGTTDNNNVGATWVFARQPNGSYVQEGAKLVGIPHTGEGFEGFSVALNYGGDLLAIGAHSDNTSVGIVYIYKRIDTTWTLQANLTPHDATGASQFGTSVAFNAFGNVLAIGGAGDSSNVGATWIFVSNHSGGANWTQQGSKLVGTGATGASAQGSSVSLNRAGLLLGIGGAGDNTDLGATWIFGYNGTMWLQQGAKIVGTGFANHSGSTHPIFQGITVSLNAIGNILCVGANGDALGIGATWVFTSADGGTTWLQSGLKLVGTNATGASAQAGVINGDGDAIVIGGPNDNSSIGATWFFNYIGGEWVQSGNKTIGTGAIGPANQGYAVAISQSGQWVASSGAFDDTNIGAIWVFETPNPTSNVPLIAALVMLGMFALVFVAAIGCMLMRNSPSNAPSTKMRHRFHAS